MLGRAVKQGDSDEEGEGDGGDGLVLRAADAAESHGFRALFSTEEDGALGAAAPFAGQVHVVGTILADVHATNMWNAAAHRTVTICTMIFLPCLPSRLDSTRLDSNPPALRRPASVRR